MWPLTYFAKYITTCITTVAKLHLIIELRMEGCRDLSRKRKIKTFSHNDFQISFSNRDTSRNAWNRHWGSFMVDTGILSNNMKFPSHKCEMTFCDLTIYNDNTLLIRLFTELDLLPNFEWFSKNICDGCGMPTGHAYSPGHLVPSLWDLHMFYFLRPILFRICRYFTGLCSSNIPRYFLDFAS